MRPFKIPTTNKWVDLATIQSIDEPTLSKECHRNCYDVILKWQHSFRDSDDATYFEQEFDYNGAKGYHHVLDSEGNPSKLKEVMEEVFKPFFEAWTKTGRYAYNPLRLGDYMDHGDIKPSPPPTSETVKSD